MNDKAQSTYEKHLSTYVPQTRNGLRRRTLTQRLEALPVLAFEFRRTKDGWFLCTGSMGFSGKTTEQCLAFAEKHFK